MPTDERTISSECCRPNCAVEPADAVQCDYIAALGPLDRSPGRRVTVERHMWSVVVVEAHVVPDEPEQVPLAEHDDVIE